MKQARGIGTKYFLALDPRQSRQAVNHFNRALIAHVEAVVASKHHAVSSNEVDEIAERLGCMADRVVGESPEVGSMAAF